MCYGRVSRSCSTSDTRQKLNSYLRNAIDIFTKIFVFIVCLCITGIFGWIFTYSSGVFQEIIRYDRSLNTYKVTVGYSECQLSALLVMKTSIFRNSINKNVDIKFSAHDAFLELHSSGTLKIERLESQII